MDADLGKLIFSFRAMLQQWKQDLADADRAYMDYRKKWEQPIRMGAPVATSGGPSGASPGGTPGGTPTGSMTGAPMASVGGVGGGGGANFTGTGNGLNLTTAAPQTPAPNPGMGLNAAGGGAGFTLQGQVGGGGGGGGGNPGNSSSFWTSKINIHRLVRSTVYGLVIDAVAGMVGNEATYQQNSILAGNNQIAQSRASLGRVTGGLGSVPIIGGILANAFSPFTTPIETQNIQSERQIAFGNYTQSLAARRQGSQVEQQIARAGPNVGMAARLQLQRGILASRTARDIDSQNATDEFDRANPLPDDNVTVGESFSGFTPSRARALAADRFNRESQDRNARRQNFLEGRAGAFNADIQNQTQGLIEVERTQRYQNNLNRADIVEARFQNAFRPNAGLAAGEQERFSAEVGYRNRTGMTALDRQSLIQSGELGVERLRGAQRGILENIAYGYGKQYNPFTESPLSFTDRSVETNSQGFDALTEAIEALTTEIANLKNQNPGRN